MENKKSNTLVQDALALFIITLIAGALLGGVYSVTKEPIEKAQAQAKQESYEAVFPGAKFEQDGEVSKKLKDFTESSVLADKGLEDVVISEVLVAKDDADNFAGYVMQVSGKGYGGDIQLSVAIDSEGVLMAVEILAADDETPGLGQRCTEPEWNGQYAGKSVADLDLEVVKSNASKENQIEAISGATITSKAVTRAINGGLLFIETLLGGTI